MEGLLIAACCHDAGALWVESTLRADLLQVGSTQSGEIANSSSSDHALNQHGAHVMAFGVNSLSSVGALSPMI